MMFTDTEIQSLLSKALEQAFALFSTNRLAEADTVLQQIIKVDSECARAHQMLGLVAYRQGNNIQAIRSYDKAIHLGSGKEKFIAENLNNKGVSLGAIGRHDEAITSIEEAIRLSPENASYRNNLGSQYRIQGDLTQATVSYNRAIHLEPNKAIHWISLGGVYGEMRSLDEAINCFDKALQADPDEPHAHVDLAYALFLKGQFQAAWPHYEYRLECFPQVLPWRRFYPKEKQWDGSPLKNRRLAVWCEQGVGDMIMFSRYLPLVEGSLWMHVDPGLSTLFSPMYTTFDGNPFTMKQDELPDYDVHCSIMSLPYLLKKEPDFLCIHINHKLDMTNYQGQKIGICWSGNPQHPGDSKRSTYLKYFQPLTKRGTLFSLQKDSRPRQYRTGPPVDYTEDANFKLVDLSPILTDFTQTAAAINSLDVVVTVDTAILHLAGTMGKRTIGILPYNPDWRWTLKGEQTFWYPSVRLVRQNKPGDWEGVFKKVIDLL